MATSCSLTLKWYEFPLLADAGDGEAAVFVLFDIPGVDKLLENGCCQVTILFLLLNLLNFLLNSVQLSQLVFDLLILVKLSLLIGLNLVLGSAPL